MRVAAEISTHSDKAVMTIAIWLMGVFSQYSSVAKRLVLQLPQAWHLK